MVASSSIAPWDQLLSTPGLNHLEAMEAVCRLRCRRRCCTVVQLAVAAALIVIVIVATGDWNWDASAASEKTHSNEARVILSLLVEDDGGIDGCLDNDEARWRLQEAVRIKQSVLLELRTMEKERREKRLQLESLHSKIEELRAAVTRERMRLRVQTKLAKKDHEDYMLRDTPDIRAPLALLPSDSTLSMPPSSMSSCTMDTCFDFSRCSLISGFPVFFRGDVASGLRLRQEPHHSGPRREHQEHACLLQGHLGQPCGGRQ